MCLEVENVCPATATATPAAWRQCAGIKIFLILDFFDNLHNFRLSFLKCNVSSSRDITLKYVLRKDYIREMLAESRSDSLREWENVLIDRLSLFQIFAEAGMSQYRNTGNKRRRKFLHIYLGNINPKDEPSMAQEQSY